MNVCEFEVIGHPQPAGSKRAFPIRRGGELTGRVAVADANPRARGWQHAVADTAAQRCPDDGLMAGPLVLQVTFWLARPVGHYGSGRNRHRLRPAAPHYPAVRPDITKLLRAVEDALTGVLWRDDAQIVTQVAAKRYSDPEGALIRVHQLDPLSVPAIAAAVEGGHG